MWRSLLLIILLSLLGCSILSGNNVAECADGTALMRDSFGADANCGWALYSGSESAEIANGVLTLSASTSGVVAWTNPGRTFDNTEITVQTRQVSGPNDNAYGLICRYADDENFYIFLISGDGFYAIGKYERGVSQIQYLTGEDPNFFVQSDVINTGIATNLLRVTCIGDQLTLAVNGTLVAAVNDNSFSSGDIGVAASTFEPDRVVIEFDNLTVSAP
jgi:hypothetical protein